MDTDLIDKPMDSKYRKLLLSGNGPRRFTPLVLSNLAMWWNLDRQDYDQLEHITFLNDSTTNNADATQATEALGPTFFTDAFFNNHSVMVFNGVDQFLEFSVIPFTNWTAFWMSAHLSVSQSTILGSSSGAFGTIRQISDTTTGVIFNGGLSKTYTHADVSGDRVVAHMMTSDHRHWLDGVPSSVVGLDSSGLNVDRIGITGAGFPSSAIIGEIGVYMRVLTDPEIEQVGTYMADKYALSYG